MRLNDRLKIIDGFDHQYLISENGRVISPLIIQFMKRNNCMRKIKKRTLKTFLNKRGYECVALRKNGKTKIRKVHRLVAIAFIPNPENKPQVNHIDLNKTNNNLKNLEWVTNSENRNHYLSKIK